MTREQQLALAGDYVLGLMDDPERAAFEAAVKSDAELASVVDQLVSRMASLDDSVTPVVASANLWSRIETAIAATAQTRTSADVLSLPRRNAAPANLRSWYALAASVVLALGIGYAAGGLMQASPAPTVIAVLLDQTDASPAVIVEAFADDSVHLVPLDSFAVPEGQIMQVWTLPDAATGPVSLGTLTSSQDIRLNGPKLPLPQDGQLYEITLEPAPGSPTGRPTGPILVKGFAKPPISQD